MHRNEYFSRKAALIWGPTHQPVISSFQLKPGIYKRDMDNNRCGEHSSMPALPCAYISGHCSEMLSLWKEPQIPFLTITLSRGMEEFVIHSVTLKSHTKYSMV